MWQFLTLLQEHNNALWAGHGQSFYRSNLALSTHVEKFPKRSNMKSTFCQSHLEDYNWENKIGGKGHWYNWAIKTYLLQMEFALIWLRMPTHTNICNRWWFFASFKLNWCHQTAGMSSIIGFWLRCRVHPKNDISTWIKLSFPFLDQLIISDH